MGHLLVDASSNNDNDDDDDDSSSSGNSVLSVVHQKVWEREELEIIYSLYATVLAGMTLFGSCAGLERWLSR